MEEYLIVSDNTTGELFIMRKASRLDVLNVYKYEPIGSCETLSDTIALKNHIEQIGVHAYFDEVVASIEKG